MAGFSVIEDFRIEKNEAFLEKARSLKPKLLYREVEAVRFSYDGVWSEEMQGLSSVSLAPGKEVILDMGEHVVGYPSFNLGYFGSHPDAPAYLYVKFAERLQEFEEETKDYKGWLGKGWIQEEYVHVDVVPSVAHLSRRFSFRYVLLRVIDTSPKYTLSIQGASATAVSAVDMSTVSILPYGDKLSAEMDKVGLCTLRDCMQDVFEDGVKRDRRLWLGDFRLQALTNYVSFKNVDLAKRCLYLFGGLTFNGGHLVACLFTEPTEEPDDTYLEDFACLYSAALYDYYTATGDEETLHDLYPVAIGQLRLSLDALTEEGVVKNPGEAFSIFMDWGEGLDKQCGGTGALLYCLGYGMKLAKACGDEENYAYFKESQEKLREASRRMFWDGEMGLFVSGPDAQVSWCSQVWMVLGGVVEGEEARQVLSRIRKDTDARGIITPYMYHYYIEALLACGDKNRAIEEMKNYWGAMVLDGADTYWETFDPKNPDASPYGSLMANSYCHAWSCTVSYFLRTLFTK